VSDVRYKNFDFFFLINRCYINSLSLSLSLSLSFSLFLSLLLPLSYFLELVFSLQIASLNKVKYIIIKKTHTPNAFLFFGHIG